MPSSDALIVGEDWISEHYFTTDAKSESFQAKVTERRKAWDEDAKNNGASTVRTRFIAARASLGTQIADLLAGQPGVADNDLPELYADLRHVLGYESGEYVLKRVGPVIGVVTPDLSEGAPLVIVEARAVPAVEDLIARTEITEDRKTREVRTLLTPYDVDEKTTITSVARLLSALFVADDGPEFALVLAGRWLLVAERARWAEGRYLAVDLQLVCERNETKSGGEIDRALVCVSAESLAPDAEGSIWWRGVLEDSVKHTVGVSKDLREGVRLSIEIIANEVVSRRQKQGLRPAAAGPGAAAGPAVAALPVPDPVPALRRGLPRARGAAGRRGGVRPGLRPRPAPRADARRTGRPARHRRHAPVRVARPAVHARRPGPRAAGRYGRRAGRPGLPQPARRPVPARRDRADRRDRTRERRAPAGAAPPAAQQGGQGQGPRLHLLRRTRHQPARRGLRGPDVLHRLLRRDRPVRGGQGRRRRPRGPGSSRSSGPAASPRATSSAWRTRSPASSRLSCTSAARSSTASPAGSGSSRRRTTRPRCSPASPCPRRWRSCSTRTGTPRPPRRSWG